jgi:phage terminase small subunit
MTPKQKEFARKYLETGCASAAYRAAYSAENMSPGAVKVEAHRMLQHPNVALTIESLQAAHRERHEITIDRLTDMALKAYEIAEAEKSPAAMVSAVQVLGKMHGKIVDRAKHEHTGANGAPLLPIINVTCSRGVRQ